jgi:invasion protein IalB
MTFAAVMHSIRKTVLGAAIVALAAIPAAQAQAPAKPAAPNVSKQVYGAWSLLCVPVQTGGEACEIRQALLNDKKQQVADVAIFRKGAEMDLRIDLPIGVYLRKNPTLRVDNGGAIDGPSYLRCNPRICIARMTTAASLLDSMRRGTDLTVTFNVTSERTMSARLALKGYADAEKALLTRVK